MPPTPIQTFLSGPDRSPQAMSYHQLQGFLFTVCSAPKMAPPSAWMPIVFGGRMPEFASPLPAQEILGSLIALYNEINSDVFEHAGRLPRDCPLRRTPLSNLDDDAPIGHWSSGFVLGHNWLIEAWDGNVPPGEIEDELTACLMTLTFFSSTGMAQGFLAECAPPHMSLADMAKTVCSTFRNAARSYAALGRSIHEALLVHSAAQSAAVKRNELCPCGSGRKFKVCCGRVG
jgi:uncharacterized protein